MGVNNTGAIFKGFTFNGINSKDYGVYITGEAVYNAPERDVELINIAGRNGAFVLDKGRFNNILVSYPAGMYGDNQEDFAEGISALRNALAASVGYCRLEDEYNPDEYREAVYKSGLDVSPEQMGRAGAFNITFECKPQRFLTEGETAETIAQSGDTLTNPTLFASRPLLEVTGYGNIGINDDNVEIISAPVGRVKIRNSSTNTSPAGTSAAQTVGANYAAYLNTGDAVEISGGSIVIDLGVNIATLDSFTTAGDFITGPAGVGTTAVTLYIGKFSFNYGTAKTASASVVAGFYEGGQARYNTISVNVNVRANGSITITTNANLGADLFTYSLREWYGISSKSALGDPVYIDLDLGEAYKIENGTPVSVNNAVSLGVDLPELQAGANEITYDNTITALKIKPRWWKV